jgi:hypothetical protein
MTRVRCDCGFVVDGDELDVVGAIQQHGRDRHGIELATGLITARAVDSEASPSEND